MIIEPPIQSLTEAISAESLGATQLELCADLDHDGLTPSRELISEVIHAVSIPVKVMIRPHYRNFMYNKEELTQMRQDITMAKELGATGIVLGILNENKSINLKDTKALSAHANTLGLQVTFHKAIDDTPNLIQATIELAKLGGIYSILSSGGKPTAREGLETLKRMMEVSDTIQILAAGKITNENLHEIHAELNTTAYHGRRILGP